MNKLMAIKNMKSIIKKFYVGQIKFNNTYNINRNILKSSFRFSSLQTESYKNKKKSDDNIDLVVINNKIYEIPNNSSQGQIVKVNDDVIYFTNFDQNKLKIKSLLSLDTESFKTQALVLSLNEKVSSALCLNNLENHEDTLKQESVSLIDTAGLKIHLNWKQIKGKIINFRGEVLNENAQSKEDMQNLQKSVQQQNDNDFELDFTLSDFNQNTVLRKKRQTSQHQIFTGNITVDMTQPVCQGNFVIINGDTDNANLHLTTQMIKQNCQLNQNSITIYSTQNFNTAKKVQTQLQSNTPCQNNFIVVSPSQEENAGMAEKYFSPLTAIHLAYKLQQEQGKDVIIIYDNIYEHFQTENQIFSQIGIPSGLKSVIKELFSMNGSFGKGNGSISSVCIFDSNQTNEYPSQEMKKLYQEAESYADVNIDLNQKEPHTHQPRLQKKLKNKQLFSTPKWQNNLFLEVGKELNDILKEVKDQSKEIDQKKQLKLSVEPYDYYLYYDSEYFMKLLNSTNHLTPIEQIVFVKFVIKSIREETISQFKETPQELTNSFFKYAKELKIFNKQDIFSYIQNEFDYNNNQMHENTVFNIQESIIKLYEKFIQHCQENDKFHQFKKDYLN